MRNDTRALFAAYLAQVASLSGVSSAHATFAVDPTVQQKLETRIQESSDFLAAINLIPVDELMGQKVGLGVSGTIASRTDTSGTASRSPRDVSNLTSNNYECKKTDFTNLQVQLSQTQDPNQTKRPPVTGGDGKTLTDC